MLQKIIITAMIVLSFCCGSDHDSGDDALFYALLAAAQQSDQQADSGESESDGGIQNPLFIPPGSCTEKCPIPYATPDNCPVPMLPLPEFCESEAN